LTPGEIALARSVFGAAIDYAKVRIRRRRWHPLQPRQITMAPCGNIHFHPQSPAYREDFSAADLQSQGLFIHEMTHVWQTQNRGRFYLPVHRHPFCRYGYVLVPGKRFERYGIEQQAEIVRHAFLLERGLSPPGAAKGEAYQSILPFERAA
jgi:hypothetical protein